MISITANRFNGGKVPIPGGTGIASNLALAEAISIIGIGLILASVATGVLPHYAAVPGAALLLSATADALLALFMACKRRNITEQQSEILRQEGNTSTSQSEQQERNITFPQWIPPHLRSNVKTKNQFTEVEYVGDLKFGNEILLHILSYLSIKDRASCNLINSFFRDLIQNYQPFLNAEFKAVTRKFINLAKKYALETGEMKDYYYLKIVKIEKRFNIDEAKLTASKITDPKLLAKVWYAIYNVEKTSENLEHLTNSINSLAPALKSLMLYKIYNINPENSYLKEAENLITNISYLTNDKFWIQIIKEEAKHNLENAEKYISKIFQSYLKFRAWLELYKIHPNEAYIAQAKKIASKSLESISPKLRMWVDICEVEPTQENLVLVKKYAQKLPQQDSLWKFVVKTEATYDLNRAKKILQNVPQESFDQAQVYIIEEEAKTNLRAAITRAMSIQNPGDQVMACLSIISSGLNGSSIKSEDEDLPSTSKQL